MYKGKTSPRVCYRNVWGSFYLSVDRSRFIKFTRARYEQEISSTNMQCVVLVVPSSDVTCGDDDSEKESIHILEVL